MFHLVARPILAKRSSRKDSYPLNLVEINWAPSTRQIRQFGILCAFVFPVLGWLTKIGQMGLSFLLVFGLLVAVLSFVWPIGVRWLFVGLVLAAAPVGIIVSELAILLIFLGIFLPTSLVFRLRGRDALGLKTDKYAATYWQPKREPTKVSSYFRRY